MTRLNSSPCDALRFKSFQDLAHRQIGRLPRNLFAGFTGLRYHVVWAPPVSLVDHQPPWPGGCAVCCELAAVRGAVYTGCQTCSQNCLPPVLDSEKGQHFVCHLGIVNYCLPIRVCGETVGIAYLQALDGGDGLADLPEDKMTGATSPFTRLDRHGFRMASHLLRILIRSAEAACLAATREVELADARQAVAALEQEQSHLHELIDRPQLIAAHLPCHHQSDAHADLLPSRVLSYLAANFAQPITLHSCAEEFGMNAAYLSDLFSRTFGVSFKTCLTELRVEKAKELLADPTLTVAGVAFVVGYASENRFRSAFKQATGLPPRVWRRTMLAVAPTSD